MNTIQKKNPPSFRITGDWNILSKNLQKKFSNLTEIDLKFETGNEDELIKRMATGLNKKKEEVVTPLKKEQGS